METEIPQIPFDRAQSLAIEVMKFQDLAGKLERSMGHDPYAAHRIQFYLILVVTKNTYIHSVDLLSYELKKGSALFVANDQVHHFTKGLQKAEGFAIVLHRDLLDRYAYISDALKFSRLFNYHIETPVIHQEEMGNDSLIEIVDRLYQEYTFPNDFAKAEFLQTLLQVFLLKAERAKAEKSSDRTDIHWLELFSAFKNRLEKDFVKTRSSRYYAAELSISYKFLNDIVKKLSGKTVKAFIDDLVTTEIKRYLVSTDHTVKEICFLTGFDEPPNMVRFFRKNTSMTPLQFRQEA